MKHDPRPLAMESLAVAPPAAPSSDAAPSDDTAAPARPLWLVLGGVATLATVLVATFGFQGLFLAALAAVPVLVLILIRLAWG